MLYKKKKNEQFSYLVRDVYLHDVNNVKFLMYIVGISHIYQRSWKSSLILSIQSFLPWLLGYMDWPISLNYRYRARENVPSNGICFISTDLESSGRRISASPHTAFITSEYLVRTGAETKERASRRALLYFTIESRGARTVREALRENTRHVGSQLRGVYNLRHHIGFRMEVT